MDRKLINEKVSGLRERFSAIGKAIGGFLPIVYIMRYIARFGTGFLFARAVIFGTYAPFGIAISATGGIGSVFGIIGSVCGYLSILYRANGLKYIAICVLVYTAGFVFRDTSLFKKRWFMPLAATISTAAIGFVFVADSKFAIEDVSFYTAEVLLVTLCSYFYAFCFSKKEDVKLKKIGIAVVLATFTISLVPIKIWGSISVGCAVATLFIMLAGYYGGIGIGSAVGIVLGISACASGADIYLCAMYGLCGLLPAIFRSKGRLIYTMVYIIADAVCMLWLTMQIEISHIYEAFFASVFFLPICEVFEEPIKELVGSPIKTEADNYSKRVQTFAQTRLNRASQALEQLARTMENAFRYSDKSGRNITAVFETPIQQICKKCMLCNNCWEREYVTTREALNDVTGAMRERGTLAASDFPIHFSSRCIRVEELVGAINQELVRFLHLEQCKARIEESRSMVGRQYKQMSDIFEEFAKELATDPHFDEQAEDKLSELLNSAEVRATPWVYRDSANHVRVHIEGEDLQALCNDLEQLQKNVADILKMPVTYPRVIKENKTTCISLRQMEPLCATIGVAVQKKHGGEVSGDSGSYFRMEDGRVCVILADGMGSGKEAAKLSATAISLLERFLQSGIGPALSLEMINSALVLKGEKDGGFTTVDFMQLDLYTGNGDFYKLGSAPSYIKRGYHVRRLCGNTLPAGVPCKKTSKSERLYQRLHSGDFVVFATDGIADKNEDSWLVDMIAEFDGTSAKQLAAEIMAGACAKYGRSDDMSVIVLRVDKNE